MNRIVLIGNGFDLAHGLPTRYDQFIDWYFNQWIYELRQLPLKTREDKLCKFQTYMDSGWAAYLFTRQLSWRMLLSEMSKYPTRFKYESCEFLKQISNSIETKGWVDIENEYYNLLNEIAENKLFQKPETLNGQLKYLQNKLVEYLEKIDVNEKTLNKAIMEIIYSPFKATDISVKAQDTLNDHFENWLNQSESEWRRKLYQFNISDYYAIPEINTFNEWHKKMVKDNDRWYFTLDCAYKYFMLPNSVLLLNFNYTQTAELYLYNKKSDIIKINYIHGKLSNPDRIIFGYGDELDDKYNKIKRLNENEYLRHFKSSKYLESSNYRQLLQFIESEPYQIYIMGHSCGISDRTLLNTLFEHDNCVSIKPYYYQKDNETDDYLDIIQNISRNFTDMKKMRDRVVNKTYCEPLPQKTFYDIDNE